MEAVNPHMAPTAGSGELVLQNSRQAGARRPVIAPTTLIGRHAGCEVRLNVEGVDPLHCLLAFGSDGVQVRDLDSLQGTYVNGQRIENAILTHGDMLKVGPFEFRLEWTAKPIPLEEAPIDDIRETLRIQAAAVAAQQIALEEEEVRLQQRRSDLQQQEEQLAAHLAEKQRQVQLWSDHAKADRENLRKEKIEQEERLAHIEQELDHAKQDVAKDGQKLADERERIAQVYKRLRQRWQKHWSAEKEKHQKHAKKLHAEAQHLESVQAALAEQEANLKQAIAQANSERELEQRQLQESRAALAGDQERWRRRRSGERAALKARERDLHQTQIKIKEAHDLLRKEKRAWDRQLDALQKELHGLNNRVLHQRDCLHQRTDEIARLDALLRERRSQAGEPAPIAAEVSNAEGEAVVADVGAVGDPPPTQIDDWQRRCDELDYLASDLADQRLHLIEQYRRLAEIQHDWQGQRDHVSAALESLARRLVEQEHGLTGRDQQTAALEQLLRQRQEEIETVRQEIEIWRAQLRAREQLFEENQQKQLLELREKETLVQKQSSALTKLRERWNRRRQQEVQQLRAQRATLEVQNQEIHAKRLALFENGQQVQEEKRILAEKALALEQHLRAKDPSAEGRVERLRRRWLTLNAELIRNAKIEQNAIRQDLARLETERATLAEATDKIAASEAAVAEKQTLLEEREVLLMGRQEQRGPAGVQDQHLRFHEGVDSLPKEAGDQADAPAIDKAA